MSSSRRRKLPQNATEPVKTANTNNSVVDNDTDRDATRSKYFKKDSSATPVKKLDHDFFEKSCEDLAKALLGTVLAKRLNDGTVLRGKIVETESYIGGEDTASHSHKGKRTPRNEPMFMAPGTAYVYSIHTYVCMNISSQGEGAAVLLRALEPLSGLEKMRTLRGRRRSDAGVNLKEKELTNGPSKFTEALGITKEEVNKLDLADNDSVWLEEGDVVDETQIVKSARININCSQEWKEAKLRFYILGNKFVSVRNKATEKLMTE